MNNLVRGVMASRKLVGRQLETADPRWSAMIDRRGTGQLDQVGVADPVRGGDDHLVARARRRPSSALWIECFAPLEMTTCAGVGRQAVMLGVVLRDRLAKLRNSGRRRVMGLAAESSLSGRRLLDVLGRVEIGLAQGEIQDFDSLATSAAWPRPPS